MPSLSNSVCVQLPAMKKLKIFLCYLRHYGYNIGSYSYGRMKRIFLVRRCTKNLVGALTHAEYYEQVYKEGKGRNQVG